MTASSKILCRTRAVLARGAVLAAVMMVAACGSDTTFWSPAAAPKANKLELTHLNHDVAFAADRVEIDTQGMQGLNAFLGRHSVGYGDRVYVVVPTPDLNPISVRRAEGVARLLARQGIKASVLANAEWAGAPTVDNAVRVLVHRFVVIAPRCPDWSKPSDTDYGNTQASNFGCANAVNFGMMLADPRDMIDGKQAGPASGETAAAAVKRYYDDKVKALAPMDPGESSGGGGK